jgi:membrane-associated protein
VNPLDAKEIVATLGTLGVLATLFIETGLLVGLLLPGDSLLFVAGIAASGTAREIFGNQLSYTQLLIWSRFFNQERVAQTEHWLMKYGLGKALILSHFIPFVRTLINPLCGIIGIPAKKFFIWNIIGSYIWTVSLISAGYLLGERLEGSVDKYLLPIIAVIIALSLAPIAIEFLKDRKKRKSIED